MSDATTQNTGARTGAESGAAAIPEWCDWPEADWLAPHFRKEMAECRTMRDLRATAENILGCVESLRARVRSDRTKIASLFGSLNLVAESGETDEPCDFDVDLSNVYCQGCGASPDGGTYCAPTCRVQFRPAPTAVAAGDVSVAHHFACGAGDCICGADERNAPGAADARAGEEAAND